MKKAAEKILCFLFAAALIFCVMPYDAAASEETGDTGDDAMQQALYLITQDPWDTGPAMPSSVHTYPGKVTVEEASEKLESFIEKFEGKFFTVSGSYCKASGVHATYCSNCLMSNVIATGWVRELVGMGELSASLCPTQYSYNGKQGSADGYQCFGFANFAHWYIFAERNTDKVTSTLEFTGPMTFETIRKARPGDVIRSNYYGGHSMVFINCDEDGFNVIDSNHTANSDGKSACIVKVHKVKYNSRYTVAVTGTANYDRTADCEHSYIPEVTPPTSTEKGYTTYTCRYCGESYVDNYTEPLGFPEGDINFDGKTDVEDAHIARLIAAKLIVPTEQQKTLGDVDGDGKITAVDANYIRRFAVGIIDSFPA